MPPEIAPVKPPAGTVPIFDPGTNNILAVHESEVPDYIQAGAQLATPEQLQVLGEKNFYSEKPWAAAAAGAARGLSLGTSDIFLPEAGVASRETLSGLQKYNPAISAGTEFGGAVLPIVFSMGEGALAKGASMAPTALLSRAGLSTTEAAQKLIAKELVGSGLSAGAKAAIARTGAMTLGAGLEGAAYGAGKSISEQALGDPEFTAESLMAGHGLGNILKGSLKGMAFAGGTAGALTAGAALMKPFTSKVIQSIQDETASSIDSYRNRMATRAMGPFKRETRQLARHAMGSEEYAEAAAQVGNKAYLDPALAGAEVIGKDLIDEGVVPYENLGEASVKVNQARQLWGQKIGDLVDQIEAKEGAAEPLTFGDLQAKVKSEILDPLRAKKIAPFSNIADDVEGMLNSRFATAAGEAAPEQAIGLSDLIKFRRDVDDTINWASVADKLPNTWKQRFRGLLENAAESRINQLADPETLAAYQLAKRKYASMSWGAEAAKNRLAAYSANNLLSITDKGIMGLFGLGQSIVHGGFSPGTLAAGAIGGFASKYLREHGASMTVAGLKNAQNLNALFAGNNKFTRLISQAAEGMLSPQMRIAAPAIAYDVAQNFRNPEESHAFLDRVAASNITPGGFDDGISAALAQLNQTAPSVATALAIKMGKALQYTQAAAPQRPLDPFTPVSAQTSDQNVSDADRAKWERTRAAIDSPEGVLKDIASGKVSPETLKAFQEAYPAMFSKLQQVLAQKMMASKVKPSFQNRLMASKVVGQPMVRSLQPKHFITLQKNVSIPPAAAQPRPMSGTNLKMDMGKFDSNIARATRR